MSICKTCRAGSSRRVASGFRDLAHARSPIGTIASKPSCRSGKEEERIRVARTERDQRAEAARADARSAVPAPQGPAGQTYARSRRRSHVRTAAAVRRSHADARTRSSAAKSASRGTNAMTPANEHDRDSTDISLVMPHKFRNRASDNSNRFFCLYRAASLSLS
jgi:hypothetical protein